MVSPPDKERFMKTLLLSGFLFITLAAPAVSFSADSAATATAIDKQADPLADLKKQQEKLQTENSINDLTLRKSLAATLAEKQKLELENDLAREKLEARLASLQAEIDEWTKKNELALKKAAAKEFERKTQFDADLAASRDRLERLRVSNDLALAESAARTREITAKQLELQLHISELQAQRAENEAALAKLNFDLDSQDRKEKLRNRVPGELRYVTTPFTNGVLAISDRRIPLNGVITMETADDIVEKINYFNNQNPEYPIFIVIDSSPGGSVMAGYKILKAMEGSPSPVYVVVKSFAASMAASIATLAKRSFAYPNAIILHHQILSFSVGNLTEQRESVKEMEEWWKRLASPVAAKMGVTLDEFIAQMYKKRSTGDWMEFGDAAKKLKWVDEIVDQVREESVKRNPGTDSGYLRPPAAWMSEKTDANGRIYLGLPRLESVDCWYLYNPDGYYRLTR